MLVSACQVSHLFCVPCANSAAIGRRRNEGTGPAEDLADDHPPNGAHLSNLPPHHILSTPSSCQAHPPAHRSSWVHACIVSGPECVNRALPLAAGRFLVPRLALCAHRRLGRHGRLLVAPPRAPHAPHLRPSMPSTLHSSHSRSRKFNEFDHTVPLCCASSSLGRVSCDENEWRISRDASACVFHSARTPSSAQTTHVISESIRANVRAYCVPRLRTLVSSAQSSYEPYLAAEA